MTKRDELIALAEHVEAAEGPNDALDGGGRWLHRGSDPVFCVNAATPALALVAASLRALANQEPTNE